MNACDRRARNAPPGPGFLRPLAVLLLGAHVAGCACTTPRVAGLTEITHRGSEVRSGTGLPICGYTDGRGVYHEVTGWLRVIGPDSLELTIRGERYHERVTADSIIPAGVYPDARRVVPRDSIGAVCYRQFDRGKAAFQVLGVAGLIVDAWATATAEAAAKGVAEALGSLPPAVP